MIMKAAGEGDFCHRFFSAGEQAGGGLDPDTQQVLPWGGPEGFAEAPLKLTDREDGQPRQFTRGDRISILPVDVCNDLFETATDIGVSADLIEGARKSRNSDDFSLPVSQRNLARGDKARGIKDLGRGLHPVDEGGAGFHDGEIILAIGISPRFGEEVVIGSANRVLFRLHSAVFMLVEAKGHKAPVAVFYKEGHLGNKVKQGQQLVVRRKGAEKCRFYSGVVHAANLHNHAPLLQDGNTGAR